MIRIPPDAFEQYVALGPGRTYLALAKRLGVSKRNLTRKATIEHWQERLAKIESAARERFDEEAHRDDRGGEQPPPEDACA